MNFEETLKNLTTSAHEEEARKKHEAEQNRIKAEIEEKHILQIKAIIESVFRSVQQYYPNASFEPTHTIENGEIVPYFGTFTCCFLKFDKNNLYNFSNGSAIGFKIFFTDELNIVTIAFSSIKNPDNYSNYRVQILSDLQLVASNNDFIYHGPVDPQPIKDSVENVITRFLSNFK